MTVFPSKPASTMLGPVRVKGDGAGIYIVPEPSRDVTALAADLLWPTTLTPALQYEETRERLLSVLRPLLAARRATILRREGKLTPHHMHASYAIWRTDAAGILHDTGDTLDVRAAPLPVVAAQATGMLIARPRESGQAGHLDPSVAQLLGESPALLAPLSGAREGEDILVLSLDAVPREGELALAIALARRVSMARAGTSGDHRILLSGGRASRGLGTREEPPPVYPELSAREREVMQLVAAGLRNKEIALRLQISEKTVKFHLGHIFDKLGVDSRTEALLRVIAEGMVAPGYPRRWSAGPDAPTS